MAMNVNKINQSNNFRTRLTAPKIEREYSALQMGYVMQGTGDMGKLIPVHYQELLPGQKITLNQETAVQFMPFVSNLFHEITGEILNYFVPYRLLMDNEKDWENFITSGVNGQDNTPLPTIKVKKIADTAGGGLNTLWDYFGLPIVKKTTIENLDTEEEVLAFPFRAYNLIYNEHIRIPDFMSQIELDSIIVQNSNWAWDYFTRARIYQQRGVTPTVPLSSPEGETAIELAHEIQNGEWTLDGIWEPGEIGPSSTYNNAYTGISVGNRPGESDKIAFIGGERSHYDTLGAYRAGDEELEDLAGTPHGQVRILPHRLTGLGEYGINLNDFLQSLGIMRYQVNNAKIEARYVDHLQVRWGVFPEDSRLQRPEYLGSNTFGVSTDIVTQVAPGGEGQTQQGNITGQAWGAGKANTTTYEAKEHGIIISLMTIRPKTVYEGGIPKYFSKRTKFDFPTPELMNMPDVPIKSKELKFTGNATKDEEIFGYQGIYEEYRTDSNRVTGLLRPSLAVAGQSNLGTYTLARYFSQPPKLNGTFIKCTPDKDRILQFKNQPTFIFFVRNDTKTAIPLPIQSEPAELANV